MIPILKCQFSLSLQPWFFEDFRCLELMAASTLCFYKCTYISVVWCLFLLCVCIYMHVRWRKLVVLNGWMVYGCIRCLSCVGADCMTGVVVVWCQCLWEVVWCISCLVLMVCQVIVWFLVNFTTFKANYHQTLFIILLKSFINMSVSKRPLDLKSLFCKYEVQETWRDGTML